MINCDLTRNEKQKDLFITVFEAVARLEAYFIAVENYERGGKKGKEPTYPKINRVIHFGGAIRGGKTYGVLAIVSLLCKKYPGMRAHVIRKSFPDLQRTAIPSTEKLLDGARVKWRRSVSDYYVEFENGSRIYFMQQNKERDPDLNAFKGLETNVIVCEQLEELAFETYEKCLERVGSWYIDPMPPAFVMTTFNPTYNWVKTDIFDVAQAGELGAGQVLIKALPTDNPFVTRDQWESWNLLDDTTRERFIEGNWELDVEDQFLYAFDDRKHLRSGLEFSGSYPVHISFDFNVDPMTVLAFQTDRRSFFHVVKEWRIKNADTYEACRQVREYFADSGLFFKITGDASGSNRMSGTRGHINQFQIINAELGSDLGLSWSDFEVPKFNPFISDSRVFMNTALKSFPEYFIDPEGCPELVKDCRFVLVAMDPEGRIRIAKKGMNKFAAIDNKEIGHLLDCLRYGTHVTLYELYSFLRSSNFS